jgi:DNA end-binding protein Ku
MPRAIWTGAISFGLVTVPVKLYSAVQSKTVRFNQLDSDDNSRIAMKRVNAQTGEEVPYERIVKGYEISPDRYVVIEPAELEALDPKKTKTIDIEGFVDLEEIDPLYYDHPYYLVPGTGGAKPYRLLVDAMTETNKVGIAKVVIRTKEQLVALRPVGEVLSMTTMNFHDEVIDASSLDEVPAAEDVETNKRELDIAKQLVDSLAEPFEPESYKDTYREEEEAPVPDLMSALKASLDAVRSGPPADGDGAATATKKPAARKRDTAKAGGSKKPAQAKK